MPTSGGSTAKNYIAPLSSRERLILAEWQRARVSRVTRAEIAVRCVGSRGQVRVLGCAIEPR